MPDPTTALALDPATALALVAVALIGGVGITAIGPGGILVTAALFALTTATPATVAGTASATFVATGLLGAAVYARSGELSARAGRRDALLLSLVGVVGALAGVWLNARLPTAAFGILLGAVVSLSGALVWWRTRGGSGGTDRPGGGAVAAIGFGVGVVSGTLGVGGPVLAVPLLVAAGTPMLAAVAAAQVQSVFIAGGATFGYLAQGAVSPTLTLLVGVPELVGAVLGWRLAHAVDEIRLKRALAAVLVALGPYVAFA
ncbi:sulfite exporter TauE/SafE family protein [Halomarina halobia]|uniref:sulfite exporter TauE/SafE family protein n=1 Tax=Halomarina halobia TaxID=3033386 RepID=UPI0023E7D2C7|nr:sulfite exporter TauE/SafE family protein [Halomarina sp. PSR21]